MRSYAVLLLAMMLEEYCARTGVGLVYTSPADIVFDDETLVQPDVFVVPGRSGGPPSSWRMSRRPMLAAEVISPASARHDRGPKRVLYGAQRVDEYWIVDTDSRVIERWTPGDPRPEVLAVRLAWQPDPANAALEIDVAGYFERVWGS